jgi:hypothetical protein
MSEGDRLPLVIAVHVPAIALRVGMGFLRFLEKRRAAVSSFRTALVAGGMHPELADRLARSYHDAGSIARILRNAGVAELR